MTNPNDLSLLLGGPLFQLWRRGRLCGDQLQWVRRRVAAAIALGWLPLLILTAAEQGFRQGGSAVPFLYDIQTHVRLLLAIPMLLVAELVVNERLRNVASQFVERDLLPSGGRPVFDAAVASALRLRDSRWAEACLLAIVYVVGVGLLWQTHIVVGADGWYGSVRDGTWHRSWAGWWLICVSMPLFQFLLLRWYYRLFIWARFLWQVSRMRLKILPTHPDRFGGLGFLSAVGNAFTLLLLAQGAVVAGVIGDRILFAGAKLVDFKADLAAFAAILVAAVLGPLLVFTHQMADARRQGLREYGTLAQRYVHEYDHKWLRGGAPAEEPLLGSADIQSLADLGNSFEVIAGMRWVPFTWNTVVLLTLTVLIPALPLTLTMISVTELLERVLKMIL